MLVLQVAAVSLLQVAPLEPPDPRDVAFPHGYHPSDADRKLVAAAPARLMAGMGGRHSMDNNDPDVLRGAQWATAHLLGTECMRRAFPSASKVELIRVSKAESQAAPPLPRGAPRARLLTHARLLRTAADGGEHSLLPRA
jgi:hypothetical protein